MDSKRERRGTTIADRTQSDDRATPPRLSASRFEPPPLESPLTDLARARVARDARSELELVLAEAAEEGRAAGFEAGFASGETQLAAVVAEHERAVAALRGAIATLASASADLAARDAATLADLETVALEMAVGIAEALVGRELDAVDEPLLEACRRSARFVPTRGDVVVRVDPATAARLTGPDAEPGLVAEITQTLGAHHRISFVADPTVELTGCVVHVGALRIDAQIGSALARVRSELAVGSSQPSHDATSDGASDPPRIIPEMRAHSAEPGPSQW